MSWTSEKINKYHQFAKTYISTYNTKIDCADLALAALVDFAAKEKLPVKLKYYTKSIKGKEKGKWEYLKFDPKKDDAKQYKAKAMRMLGALNVIDNTRPITIDTAKSGDLIMSRWNSRLGHTRIVHSVEHKKKIDKSSKDKKKIRPVDKYEVTWYQGNLPPVVPEKKTGYFSKINNVFGDTPRRWNFDQFK